jgi:hypothetical protein
MKVDRVDPTLQSMRSASAQLMLDTPGAIGIQEKATRNGNSVQVQLTYQASPGAASQTVTYGCTSIAPNTVCEKQ